MTLTSRPDALAMSIDGSLTGSWGTSDADLDRRPHGGPSGALLRPDGPAEPLLPIDPRRVLALDAIRIMGRLRSTAPVPGRWLERSFGREVEFVRAHLQPIRTRAMLAASFGREAFHVPVLRDPETADERGLESAVRVAYALRWLELGNGSSRPIWAELLVAGPSRGGRSVAETRRAAGDRRR
jgi:hypothetical protein